MEWWVDNPNSYWGGAEGGDLCAWYFPGTDVIGQTPSGQFNQLIGIRQYYIQGEWSNSSATTDGFSGCVWADPPPAIPASSVAPAAPTGTAQFGSTLTAIDTGSWTGAPTYIAYQCDRCDQAGPNCVDIYGATANAIGSTGVAVDSAPTVAVAGEPEGGIVNVTGTLTGGHALQAVTSGWSPAATSYTTLWQRCDSLGNYCTTIKTLNGSATTTSY